MLRKLLLGAALSCLAGLAPSPAPAATQTVTLLDRAEPYDAMTVHAGRLWVGKSRDQFNSHYVVESYDAEGQLVASVELPHSVTFLYPYDERRVLAFGTGYEPNLTQYTLIEETGGRLTARTTQIPMEAWGNLWVGTYQGREFFTDMGGNQDDPARDADFSLASQTIFGLRNGTPRYLTTRLRMPIDGIVAGSKLYVVHREAIGYPQSNLVQVDPNGGAPVDLFPSHRNLMTKVVALRATPWIAVSESGADQVVFVDTRAPTTVSVTATAAGQPRAMTPFGHCLLAGGQANNKIAVIDTSRLDQGAAATVASLPVGLADDEFRTLRNIAVDETTNRIYVRSNYACNPLAEVCDKDYNRVAVLSGDDVAAAVAACR
jgi:hypothetical protein